MICECGVADGSLIGEHVERNCPVIQRMIDAGEIIPDPAYATGTNHWMTRGATPSSISNPLYGYRSPRS